ncbi:hypothetical protein BCT92_19290 [Vibrio sp. 10N.261.52.E5]|uniref:Uncharacterized protein n=1 Tax=Vibrio cyclitrophicus TaxID=47951 RepID=A0A7Z1MEM7_9VIBR|nr:hypothetical protein BCT92_19290 [Vibrio sp. 10N.261.52.E5]PMP18140.1 hypothetical protein BCS91_25010 [Vibrio cyclitrophicus]PMP22818.1 hypothetical protein BCS90_25735 [Vibrio cyclitrophicus]
MKEISAKENKPLFELIQRQRDQRGGNDKALRLLGQSGPSPQGAPKGNIRIVIKTRLKCLSLK